MSGALPVLDLYEVVDVDAAASVIGPLQDEMADIEAELARLEDECARIDAEIDEGLEPGSPTVERAAVAIERMVTGWLVAEREVMALEVEEAQRVAAERVCRATDEATELASAARLEVAAALVQRVGGTLGAASMLVADQPAHVALPFTDHDVATEVMGARTDGILSVGEAASIPDRTNQTEPASPGAAGEQVPQVASDDPNHAAFGAFWREADRAAATRDLAMAPLSAVLPMVAALCVIVALFLFVI